MTSTEHHSEKPVGTSQTETKWQPMPMDVYKALQRLEVKRLEDVEDYDDEPSDYEMMAAFGTKWHDGL